LHWAEIWIKRDLATLICNKALFISDMQREKGVVCY
jgi:hypothetical protein